ncbi:MAG: PIN domain-containing protein [Archaeoglobus sp.]|nr:PIN domain-containing protein [Archaeoglobus sp.]
MPYDTNHEGAKELFTETDTIIIPYEILIETLTVLLYKEGPEFTRAIYETLESAETFVLYFNNQKYLEKSLTLFLNQENKLSYFDYVAISLSKLLRQELLTFDERQMKEFLRK